MNAHIVVAASCLSLALAACGSETAPFARAYRATTADQLIGGDVAMARLGDFIMENDRIRVAILGDESSPAPGVFGGTLVDADLQRPEDRFRNGSGADQLAEVIPVANLLWPRPGVGDVEIIADGSDGQAAIVRVTGDAGVFLEALSILRGDLVALLFPGVRFDLKIQTDYILEPGRAYVRMVSTAYQSRDGGPPTDVLPLPSVSGPIAIFPTILGQQDVTQPGMMAGDFLFFGARNDIFAPGIGFDEEKPIFDALFEGRDTFTYPLSFDFMAAAGGDVSYGYFNVKTDANDPDPKVLVPIITSSSTGFVTAAKNCAVASDDDNVCDRFEAWSWERYLVVGAGDVASVADIVHETRGVTTGTLRGVVMGQNGNPLPNARVFVMRDPGPATPLVIEAIVKANIRDTGSVGLVNAIDADVGRDMIEDGDFRATMPPGDYIVFAQNEARSSTSAPFRIRIEAERATVIAPIVPLPARVRVRVNGPGGVGADAKLTLVALDGDGKPYDGDGLRRPWLGEARLNNGIRLMEALIGGEHLLEVEPGRYELHASRGPTWSKATQNLDLKSGMDEVVTMQIRPEVDTAGWISGDFHLHAEASFDSGMTFAERIRRVLIEGIDLAVSTDHDVIADYAPTVHALGLQERIQTAVGVELSTLELGHFIAFPLKYNELDIPTRGAPDWTCLDGPRIMSDLKDFIDDPRGGVRIMAHPRDGFIGHISQIGLDATAENRALSLLEENNVLLSRTSCDFDAMEVFNGKRFDLIRSPTNREVILYNRCMGRIDASIDIDGLNAACPELSEGGPLTTCRSDDLFADCKQRFRRRLAYIVGRDILIRTPAEQFAIWQHIPSDADDDRCNPAEHTGEIDEAIAELPCKHWIGTYDDWMRWLDQGLNITLTGASDSHANEREPGAPRTFVRSEATMPVAIDPGAVARNVVDGKAFPTYGPFIDLTVGGRGQGETATISGETFELKLRVQTASWFGVDRIEVYVSGLLEHVVTLTHGPEVIVDFDDVITLPTPERDGFVSVIAIGTREDNLMGPVITDVPFGELQLPRVAALAFASIPAFSLVFSPTPPIPDFFPVFPLAASNAILLDTDGDGRWAPPGPLPLFCERTCATPGSAEGCESGETCLPDGVCGLPIEGTCITGPPGTEGRFLMTFE